MMHEVRSIPPAPRRVRLRPLFAHRWPLLAVGGGLFVIGCLVAWLMLLQSGGILSVSALLAAGPRQRVEGVLTAASEPREFSGGIWQEVRYRFDWEPTRLYGTCFVPARSLAAGDPIALDVLVTNPNINCIVGGVLHGDRQWLRARFWIVAMVVPGSLVLLGWLAGVFQLRRVLVHGDVSVGRVTHVARVPYVLPEMLRVSYEFRDHRAINRASRHWVRAHGLLGARLVRQLHGGNLEPMPVLHDRGLPHWNRLLLPADFLPETRVGPTAHGEFS